MKKRSLTLFLVAFFTTLTSSAQLQDYDGLGIFYRNTITSNTKLPGAINEKAFHGVDIDFSRSRFEDGNLQFSLRNRVIGDFISLIFPGNLKRIWGSDVGPGTTGFSSGFLGWYNAGWTVYQTDFINIAPGFSIHDYTYVAVSNSSKSNIPDGYLEPSGYYFAFGPCIFIDGS